MASTKTRLRLHIGIALLMPLMGWMPSAAAQTDKPARMVIGFPAGASFDTLGRLIAEQLRGILGEPWIVDNRPGVNGTIAANAVSKSPPDGKTVLFSPLATMVTEPQINKAVHLDPFKEFTPVSLVAKFEVALAVGPSAPARTLAEFIAIVKADKSKAFFSSPAPNSLPHFFGLSYARAAGMEMTHVPFSGGPAAIQALLGGQIPSVILPYADQIPLHKAGKLRILATSGQQRAALTPEVPTFKELGYDVLGSPWYAMFAPPATQAAIIVRLNRALAEAIGSSSVTGFLVKTGQQPAASSPGELAETLKADYLRWGEVIRASGIKVE